MSRREIIEKIVKPQLQNLGAFLAGGNDAFVGAAIFIFCAQMYLDNALKRPERELPKNPFFWLAEAVVGGLALMNLLSDEGGESREQKVKEMLAEAAVNLARVADNLPNIVDGLKDVWRKKQ